MTAFHAVHRLEARLTEYARSLFENGMLFVEEHDDVFSLRKSCDDGNSRHVAYIGVVKAGETYLRRELRELASRY